MSVAGRQKEWDDLRGLVDRQGLAGAGDACKILGIQRSGLPPMRRRDPSFPKPLGPGISSGPVFIRAEIEEYASRRRTRGKP